MVIVMARAARTCGIVDVMFIMVALRQELFQSSSPFCAKRLAKGCFSWPKTAENETGALRVLAEELTLLLSGIDLEKTRTREWWRRAA